jgi:hypothetical protein
MAIQGTLPTPLWQMHNQEFRQDWNSPRYVRALRYLREKNFWPDYEFDHSLDCEYLGNFCHVEKRGPFHFFRPSTCVKFPLKRAAPVFSDETYRTSYHGTASGNIKSILTYGLLPAGEMADGERIMKKNGEALGYGVYTSPSPLYAQLYAPVEYWDGSCVQTILMVRQPARDVVTYRDEGCGSVSLIGRNDIWRLYGQTLAAGELQMRTQNYKPVVIQAIIVKIHDQDPRQPGGEYHRIRGTLNEIYPC